MADDALAAYCHARDQHEAGVPVVLRRHPDLIHGFANVLAVARFREAMFETAGALRTGLQLSTAGDVTGTFRTG